MKKLLPQILGLAVIDFILIWFWVKNMNPSPDVSLYLIVLVPLVIGINLIIAGILYFLKKELVKLFLINSIISAVLMFVLFGEGVDRYLNETYNEWAFQKADTTFSILHHKESNTFSFLYSTSPSASTGFLDGNFVSENGQIMLTTDSTKFIIRNGYLIGFRSDSLKIRKHNW